MAAQGRKPQPRKSGGPNGGGPEGWGVFFPLPPQFRSFFFLSLGVSSWNYGRGARPKSTQRAR